VGDEPKTDVSDMTRKKVAMVGERGYVVTGYVLESGGERAIVEKGSVRWLSQEEFWGLMHGAEGKI
jgi:hypothetical protein